MADADNKESVAETFGRHLPEHPLPEELKQMPRDETVCKFCGVSYLIHNEIKALEEKLKATLAEMEHFRGSVEREKRLAEQLASAATEREQLQGQLVAKEATICTLQNEIGTKDDACRTLQQTRATLQEKLGEAINQEQALRRNRSFLVEGIQSFKTDLGHHKASLAELKVKLNQQGLDMKSQAAQLGALLLRYSTNDMQKVQDLRSQVSALTREKESAHKEIRDLQDQLAASAAELSQLSVCADNESKLKYQVQELQDTVHALESERITLSNQMRTTEFEFSQLRDQMSDKSSDIEKLTSQLHALEKSSQAHIMRLQQDLDERGAALEHHLREQRELQRRCEEMSRSEEETKRRASASHVQVREVEEELTRIRGDCEALKAEREMMIAAHQSQIEQLRESFKTRLSDADRWPQKLEEALRQEREKHVSELEAIQTKLKESFVMELEIEKQKHQELLNKYLSEYREADRKLKMELNTVGSRHKAEIADIHKQLSESKSRSREAESSLRKEVESLKAIIRNLESRLAKLDNTGEMFSAEWKSKMVAVQQDLEMVKEEKAKLQHKIDQMKEEAIFLQETVRKECEERFELTEALGAAREELLRLKRPPGGYSNNSTPRQGNSPLQSASSGTNLSNGRNLIQASQGGATGQRAEEMVVYKKRVKSATPHPPATKAREGAEVVDASNVKLGFDGSQSRSSGQNTRSSGGMRGGTLGDSRRRIAEAVGRT